MVMRVTTEQVLTTLNTIEILGIVYLAIALSKLRERLSRIEGAITVRKGELERDLIQEQLRKEK